MSVTIAIARMWSVDVGGVGKTSQRGCLEIKHLDMAIMRYERRSSEPLILAARIYSH